MNDQLKVQYDAISKRGLVQYKDNRDSKIKTAQSKRRGATLKIIGPIKRLKVTN
jgi:hypothetical protein